MRAWRTSDVRALDRGNAVQIAARIGRTPKAVRRMAERLGKQLQPKRLWPEATRRRAMELRKQHALSPRQISKRIGVPMKTIEKWVYA